MGKRDRSVLILSDDRFGQRNKVKDILRCYKVVVYPRDGQGGTIQAALLPVSSTEIREKVRRGLSIEGLVPAAIVEDVKRLYGEMKD